MTDRRCSLPQEQEILKHQTAQTLKLAHAAKELAAHQQRRALELIRHHNHQVQQRAAQALVSCLSVSFSP